MSWPVHRFLAADVGRGRRGGRGIFRTQTDSGRALGGAIALVVVVGGVAALAAWWLRRSPHDAAPPVAATAPLERTQALVAGQLQSSAPWSQAALAQLLAQELSAQPPASAVMDALGTVLTHEVLPTLWQECQARGSRERISQLTLGGVVADLFPSQQLGAGDLVFYPQVRSLRVVVKRALQEELSRSRWPWLWLQTSLEQVGVLSEPPWAELEAAAAHELHDFLGAYSVALIRLALRHRDPASTPLQAQDLRALLGRIGELRTAASAPAPLAGPRFDAATKQRVLATLPAPMFREASEEVGLTFVHSPDLELSRCRAELVLPVGIAGGGVTATDFDGDSRVDLYFAGNAGGRLYRNQQGGRFVDSTLR